MRLCKLAFVLCAAVISSALVFPEAFAAATAHDPCKVLTAEKFSQIMGYKATLDKTGSNQTTCFYQGPADSGGQFTILTEAASGPQADAMLQGPAGLCATSGQWNDRRDIQAGERHLFRIHQINGSRQVASTRHRNQTQSAVTRLLWLTECSARGRFPALL